MIQVFCNNRGQPKGPKSKEGKEKKLINRKRVFAGKLEGIYTRREEESSKAEGKQSGRKGVLLKTVKNQMGRGMNWEHKWEEEEDMVLRELGRRMLKEQLSMRDKALVMGMMVTWRHSLTLTWVSNISITPECRQIYLLSTYFTLAKCNFDNRN